MKDLSAYERATFRLEVWKSIAGWGVTDPEDKLKLPLSWNWTERMKRADELTAWALEEAQKGDGGA